MKTFWIRFWNEETLAARVWAAFITALATICAGVAVARPDLRVAMLAAGGTLMSLAALIPKGDFTTSASVVKAGVDPTVVTPPEPVKPPPPLGFATIRIVAAIFMMAFGFSVACTFLKAAGTNTVTCAEADPALEAQVITALIDAGEQQWLAAITALVPDKTLRDCLIAGILAAYQNPDGGFTYILPDGGVTPPTVATAARKLGESDKQRVSRRAQTYFSLTQ